MIICLSTQIAERQGTVMYYADASADDNAGGGDADDDDNAGGAASCLSS